MSATTGEPGQAPAAVTGQAPAATTSTAAPAATGDAEASKSYSEAEMKKVRDEAAAARVRLRELEKADEDRKTAALSETERLKKEAADAGERATAAETRARTALATAVLTTEASAAGMKPSAVARVVRLAGGDVAFDDEGQPTNARALIAALAKEFPEFLTGNEGTTSAANPGRGPSGFTPDLSTIPRLGERGLFKTGTG